MPCLRHLPPTHLCMAAIGAAIHGGARTAIHRGMPRSPIGRCPIYRPLGAARPAAAAPWLGALLNGRQRLQVQPCSSRQRLDLLVLLRQRLHLLRAQAVHICQQQLAAAAAAGAGQGVGGGGRQAAAGSGQGLGSLGYRPDAGTITINALVTALSRRIDRPLLQGGMHRLHLHVPRLAPCWACNADTDPCSLHGAVWHQQPCWCGRGAGHHRWRGGWRSVNGHAGCCCCLVLPLVHMTASACDQGHHRMPQPLLLCWQGCRPGISLLRLCNTRQPLVAVCASAAQEPHGWTSPAAALHSQPPAPAAPTP